MSARTGLGIVEVAVLEGLDRVGAGPDHAYVKSARTLAALDDAVGVGPDYGYEVMGDLARPWQVHLRCVDFHGNCGGVDSPAAAPRYTEARLSRIGLLALQSERGEVGPAPIGLINGNTYCGGSRPPYEPGWVVDTLERLLRDPGVPDDELVAPPSFPTGCDVGGDLDLLGAGAPATLRLSARLRPAEPRTPGWVADKLPPGIGTREISERINALVGGRPWAGRLPELDRQARLRVKAIDDLSTGDETRLVIAAEDGADLDALRDRLLEVQGITIPLRVQLPAPLPQLLRDWVNHLGDEYVGASLSILRQLVG